jgi:hypothetical protein
MPFRDRIKDFRRVKAGSLVPHKRNWRTHPQAQRDALSGVLAEIGYADALLARELADGSLELVDGHMRAELSADAVVPVLVLDIDDDEALKLLATLDPLAAMAGVDSETLAGIVADVQSSNEAVRAMLARLAAEHAPPVAEAQASAQGIAIPEVYQVVVECRDECEQRDVYERLSAEGFTCRVTTL